MPDGHTAISNWDSGEPPVLNQQDPMLESFDSDFIDGGIDDALTGVRVCPTLPPQFCSCSGQCNLLRRVYVDGGACRIRTEWLSCCRTTQPVRAYTR